MSGYDLLTRTEEALDTTHNVLLILCHEPLRPYVSVLYPPAYLPLNTLYEALYPFYKQYFASGSDYVHFPQRYEHLKQAIETLLATLREQMDERDIDRLCTWISNLYITNEMEVSLSQLSRILSRHTLDHLQGKVAPVTLVKIQNFLTTRTYLNFDTELDDIEEVYKAADLPQTSADGRPLFTEGLPFYEMATSNMFMWALNIDHCIQFKQLRDALTPDEFAALCEVIVQEPAWQKGSTPRQGRYTLVPLEHILDQFYVWFP